MARRQCDDDFGFFAEPAPSWGEVGIVKHPSAAIPDAVDPKTPLRLETAARIVFPYGSIGVSALRAEAKRGNLKIEIIANKQFTTLQAIAEMRNKCGNQKGHGCGSNQSDETKTENSTNAQRGSSETDRVKSALAALEMRVRKPSKSSPNTSPRNTSRQKPTSVIRPKF